MDNNATESTIRGFCIGRNNWKIIDTINGAQTSAIIYSIAETAKANNLKPYNYFKYLLEEIPKHMDDKILISLEIYCHGRLHFQKHVVNQNKLNKFN